MSDVFLDTVGMIAVCDETSQWHSGAAAAYELLFSQGRRLVTTPFFLFECTKASARRPYRSDVFLLRRTLIQEGLLIEPTAPEIETGWAAYERGDAGQAGIVDHLWFEVMRRLGITEDFTNDKRFQIAGFTVLF
jgi:predicted nucleic acid-binding protein